MERALPSFMPFRLEKAECGPNLTSIEVTREKCDLGQVELKLLSDVYVLWEERFRLEESKDSYFTSILANNPEENWTMKRSKDFAFSKVLLNIEEVYRTTKLSGQCH